VARRVHKGLETVSTSFRENALPQVVHLRLTVTDRDSIADLLIHPEGEPRDEFALSALRIDLLALRQASGQLDRDLLRMEAERMLGGLESQLQEHSRQLHSRLTDKLKEYFDPDSGRFEERVRRLVARDGELERVLKRQVGEEDSSLCRTLAAHFGDGSPLMKVLSPSQSEGLLAALRETLDTALKDQRDRILREFSLDSQDSVILAAMSFRPADCPDLPLAMVC